jgi:hypothetical protein
MTPTPKINVTRYRATFRNMKCMAMGDRQLLQCTLIMELRARNEYSKLFTIYYVATGKPATARLYTLYQAKQKCRTLFEQQITEWVRVADQAAAR